MSPNAPRKPRSPRAAHSRQLLILAVAVLAASACRTAARAQDIGRSGPEEARQAGEPDWIRATPDDARGGIRSAGRRTAAAPARRTAPLGTRTPASRITFRKKADSVAWVRSVAQAKSAGGYRIEVSLHDKTLFVLNDKDTLRVAPIAVGMGEALEFNGRRWFFETPRGKRKVLRKEADPVWIPPEWAYAEVAREYGLRLKAMSPTRPVTLKDGRQLVVRDSLVGVLERTEGAKKPTFAALPREEHIVFENTLYIPPINSLNRRIAGELGKYRLDLGEGYLLHGTPHQDSIGRAATHGCVRMLDDDIEWLYQNVPVGTTVYIY